MVAAPRQGEIWWAEMEHQRRPMLIVTRSAAIPVLNRIIVAPVTRSLRRIPSHFALGPEEGLTVDCAATFDNIQPIRKAFLVEHIGGIGPERRPELCRALLAVADC